MTASKTDLLSSHIVKRMDHQAEVIRAYTVERKVSRETAVTLLQLALLDGLGSIEISFGTIADTKN